VYLVEGGSIEEMSAFWRRPMFWGRKLEQWSRFPFRRTQRVQLIESAPTIAGNVDPKKFQIAHDRG